VLTHRALRNALEGTRKQHVLDVGAGTGLLGMMAARSGASFVTSCEKCEPVARSAKEITALNGLGHTVK
jgi:predicted RNA methylase